VRIESLVQAGAIEQAGQRIVVGHVLQLGLVALAIADVLDMGDDVQRLAALVTDQAGADGGLDHPTAGVDVALLTQVTLDRAVDQAPSPHDVAVRIAGMVSDWYVIPSRRSRS
jgi:hypothetical protein